MSESKINSKSETVLVTGGSGFVGGHCIVKLLNAGYHVRTTVRSLSRDVEVRENLRAAGAAAGEALSFFEADLLSDAGWDIAISGCDYVLHVASPFPQVMPKNEDDLIIPAREGALRVLRAARDAGVKRVVMTSSFAAIGYSPKKSGEPYDENDWTDLNARGVTAYVKSKTIAEHAAWDFIHKEGNGLELSVVNPVGILGPVLGPDFSTSIQLVKRLMDGTVPGIPRLSFGVVDVRDVADLHILAMTNPIAKGERFLAIAGDFITMPEIAELLRSRLGDKARKVPKMVLPNWLVRLVAVFDPSISQIIPELGVVKNASNAKARNLLGWLPRSNEEAIIATAESLL